jgi:hypothetical protein
MAIALSIVCRPLPPRPVSRAPSRIYNVADLHLKESDRIPDLVAGELSKLGCRVTPSPDAIEVEPGAIRGGVEVEAHADHHLIHVLGSTEPVTKYTARSYLHFFADPVRLCGT